MVHAYHSRFGVVLNVMIVVLQG